MTKLVETPTRKVTAELRSVADLSAATPASGYGTLARLIPSWERALRRENKSPRTILDYAETASLFDRFVTEAFGPMTVDHITKEHVECFMDDQITQWKASTAGCRFRNLRQLFRWLTEETEIASNPMENMKAPAVPPTPVPVLDDVVIRKLLAACSGNDFLSIRDTAMFRTFLDCGLRLAELANMTTDCIDWQRQTITVLGKGRKERTVHFGNKTAAALDKYDRARSKRKADADRPEFWVGQRGPLSDSGISQVLDKRAEQAEVGKLHPHLFRHTFASNWMRQGGNENALMKLAGWSDRAMIDRYGASAAVARALEAHERMAPGDRY